MTDYYPRLVNEIGLRKVLIVWHMSVNSSIAPNYFLVLVYEACFEFCFVGNNSANLNYFWLRRMFYYLVTYTRQDYKFSCGNQHATACRAQMIPSVMVPAARQYG
jgi:hypothetical protein